MLHQKMIIWYHPDRVPKDDIIFKDDQSKDTHKDDIIWKKDDMNEY